MSRVPKTRREKEIWQACDLLWEEQGDFKFLTGDAIAEKLLDLEYKKGSPNERYKYRLTWKETRGIQTQLEHENQAAALSDPLQRAVIALRKDIKHEIVSEYEPKVIQLKKECEDKKIELERTLEILNRLRTDYEKLEQEYATLKSAQPLLEQELAYARQQYALSQEKERSATKAHDDLVLAHELKIEDLKEEHTKTVEFIKEQLVQHKQESKNEFTMLRDAHELQRHQFISQIDNLKVELQKLERQADKFQSQAKISQQGLEEQQGIHKRLEEKIRLIDLDNKQYQEKLRFTDSKIAGLTSELQHSSLLAEDRKQENLELQYVIREDKGVIGRLETELKILKQPKAAPKKLLNKELDIVLKT